jgi:hypothetical protein
MHAAHNESNKVTVTNSQETKVFVLKLVLETNHYVAHLLSSWDFKRKQTHA